MRKAIALFKKHGWWLSHVAGVVTAFALGAYAMYYFVAGDVPEIKQGIREVTAEVRAIRGDLQGAENRQRSDLTIHVSQEQTARERMTSSLRVLQANMIAVRQKVEKRALKPDEMREMMSSVRDTSKIESANLTQATISGEPPRIRADAIALVERVQPGFSKLFSFEPATSISTPSVEKTLAGAMWSQNVTWEATGKGIKGTYDGGMASFAARANATQEELKQQAERLNSLSQALSQTIRPATGNSTPVRRQKTDLPGGDIPRNAPVPQQRSDVPGMLENPPQVPFRK